MRHIVRFFLAALFLLAVCSGMQGTAHAKSVPLDTQGVFGLYADRVGKVQIVEVRSGAKSGIGSGFFVSAEGHILTNYHVISRLIHFPKRYRAEFIDKFGTVLDISVVAIDIVNDLAITRSEARPIHYFTLGPVTLSKGARLYSLGYPHDIGLSIVEGTYNGYLKHARYKKIHFTGSINPGMSGGPAITAKGNVVGINVATAGNQVSFLVPAAAASKLMRSTLAAGDAIPDDFLAAVRSQLMKHQQAYLADDIMKSGKTIKLGNYELPGKLSRFFNCWADSSGKKKHAYRTVTHQCSTNDVIYVSGSQRSGIIKFRHRLLTTAALKTAS